MRKGGAALMVDPNLFNKGEPDRVTLGEWGKAVVEYMGSVAAQYMGATVLFIFTDLLWVQSPQTQQVIRSEPSQPQTRACTSHNTHTHNSIDYYKRLFLVCCFLQHGA